MQLALRLVPLTLLAGCFPVSFGDGSLKCGPPTRSCPPAYYCHSDGRCWTAPESDGGSPSAARDLASIAMSDPDLGGPASSPDMTPLACSGSGRVCAGANSGVCVAGAPVPDRTCPSSFGCSDGNCKPPANAISCTSSRACGGGNVCAPFIVAGVVGFFCAPALANATGAAGGKCKAAGPGVDPSCPSGYCVHDTSRMIDVCLFVCDPKTNNPCGTGNLSCDPAQPLSVEGVMTGALDVCAR